MFTGRVVGVGTIEGVTGEQVAVSAPKTAGCVRPGGSLNLAGVCVTLEHVTDSTLVARVSAETRRRSTFDACEPGQRVNLEPALALDDPLDGHLVLGHVDAVGRVTGADEEGSARRVWIRPPGRFMPRVAAKGSIAVDGVGFAVIEVVKDRFSVVLIPATLAWTTLGSLAAGDRVNLESDVVTRLATGHADAAAEVSRAVGALGWAGHISGRIGVEKAVTQVAAGRAVMVWDPDRETEGIVIFGGYRAPARGLHVPAHPPLRALDGAVRSPDP
jgi:riboflavin synthase alpha subunit